MTGSIKGQIYAIFKNSGLLKFGTSRHAEKEHVKKFLTKKDSHSLNKELGIYSYATYNNYVKECIIFFKFIKERFQIVDIEKINEKVVEEFLIKSMSDNISYASYKMRCSALIKLTTGLNIIRNTTKYDFYEKIQETKEVARLALYEHPMPRAYKNPYEIVDALKEPYRTIGELQLYCGLRISEATKIKADEVLVEHRQLVVKRSKGGRIRKVILPKELLKKLVSYTQYSDFSVSQSGYSHALQVSCSQLGEHFNGSHGLRWNYAQNRIYELTRSVPYEIALQKVSNELGHSRIDISKWYLQRR